MEELAENTTTHDALYWRGRFFLLEQTYEQDVRRLESELIKLRAEKTAKAQEILKWTPPTPS